MRFATWSGHDRPNLEDIGEEGLLGRLVDMTSAVTGVVIPAGDDAAAWVPGSPVALISTDAMVEGVHFRQEYQSPYQVGAKAWAQAASDIAAMGGALEVGVVAAMMPGTTPWKVAEAIQLGVLEAARGDGAALVGGDICAGPQIVLVVTVAGSARGQAPVQMKGGTPGDQLVVTGHLGGAAMALRMLDRGDVKIPVDCLQALRVPRARLAEGARLGSEGASAMTDISDGLLLDCKRLTRASRVGAELWADRVPLAAGLVSKMGVESVRIGLAGGEDYELLAAIPAPDFERVVAAWPEDLAPLAHVGSLVSGAGVRLLAGVGGPELSMEGWSGYQHY
ncbi:MAG: thiamine-phosphate kinase [Candidatus Dormibacteria bacterium]